MLVNRLLFLRSLFELLGGNYFDGYVAGRRSTRIQTPERCFAGDPLATPVGKAQRGRPGSALPAQDGHAAPEDRARAYSSTSAR
jgi:hypothetical protein